MQKQYVDESKCPAEIHQRCMANIRAVLESCPEEVVEQFVKDLPWLLKNNNFQYFESLAKRQGMWIPEQSGSMQASQVAEQKEEDQPNQSKMSCYQEVIEFSNQ